MGEEHQDDMLVFFLSILLLSSRLVIYKSYHNCTSQPIPCPTTVPTEPSVQHYRNLRLVCLEGLLWREQSEPVWWGHQALGWMCSAVSGQSNLNNCTSAKLHFVCVSWTMRPLITTSQFLSLHMDDDISHTGSHGGVTVHETEPRKLGEMLSSMCEVPSKTRKWLSHLGTQACPSLEDNRTEHLSDPRLLPTRHWGTGVACGDLTVQLLVL